jgi:hypothetical protein
MVAPLIMQAMRLLKRTLHRAKVTGGPGKTIIKIDIWQLHGIGLCILVSDGPRKGMGILAEVVIRFLSLLMTRQSGRSRKPSSVAWFFRKVAASGNHGGLTTSV